MTATGGTDTNLVIAALLHDAIEDSEVPKELIAETFADDVASIVVGHRRQGPAKGREEAQAGRNRRNKKP
jgi:(p)ppGpp synthase/HD superfamily hydrolase